VRNLTTALSATVTAIVIGLLIANVASAARAAEIAHNKEQQLAAIQDSYSASDLTVQLEAYRTRYSQAYQQLSAAYAALAARDAEYHAAIDSANAASGQLATANASLDTRLTEAYQALRDAQAAVAALRGGLSSGSPASTPQGARATATPRASGTPRASRPPDD
jgi:hypothetical protein